MRLSAENNTYKIKKLIMSRQTPCMMNFFYTSFARSLPTEKLVKSDREEAGDRQEQDEIGVSATRFPFRDGLNADVQIGCKLALSHTVCHAQSPYVATEWDLQF